MHCVSEIPKDYHTFASSLIPQKNRSHFSWSQPSSWNKESEVNGTQAAVKKVSASSDSKISSWMTFVESDIFLMEEILDN